MRRNSSCYFTFHAQSILINNILFHFLPILSIVPFIFIISREWIKLLSPKYGGWYNSAEKR